MLEISFPSGLASSLPDSQTASHISGWSSVGESLCLFFTSPMCLWYYFSRLLGPRLPQFYLFVCFSPFYRESTCLPWWWQVFNSSPRSLFHFPKKGCNRTSCFSPRSDHFPIQAWNSKEGTCLSPAPPTSFSWAGNWGPWGRACTCVKTPVSTDLRMLHLTPHLTLTVHHNCS